MTDDDFDERDGEEARAYVDDLRLQLAEERRMRAAATRERACSACAGSGEWAVSKIEEMGRDIKELRSDLATAEARIERLEADLEQQRYEGMTK